MTLFPYQENGVTWIQSQWIRGVGALLADEMGLGKTIQALVAIDRTTDIKSVLVICPKSVRIAWEQESREWIRRSIDIEIINYDRIADSPLRERQWDLLVCDEAHALKNSAAKRTKAVLGRGGISARRKLFLTGTPVLNRPSELWTLVHALDPVAWPDWLVFVKRFCSARRVCYNGRSFWETRGASNIPLLSERLTSTVMLRRTKGQVLPQIPSKRRQIITLDSPHEVTQIIQMQWRLLGSLPLSIAEWDRAIDHLRSRPSAFSEMAALSAQLADAKVVDVWDHVSNLIESGEKVILFGHHRGPLGRYIDIARDNNIEHAVIHGDVTMNDRSAAVERFQTDDRCRLMIAGIRAAGVGLTLTRATYVVMSECDWTPGIMQQAEDRAHRIGLDHPVVIQYIIYDHSIDAARVLCLEEKQTLIDGIMSHTQQNENPGTTP